MGIVVTAPLQHARAQRTLKGQPPVLITRNLSWVASICFSPFPTKALGPVTFVQKPFGPNSSP